MMLFATKGGLIQPPPRAADTACEHFSGTFIEPLIEAAADRLDVLWITGPAGRWPGRHLRLSPRPTIVVIGDDPGTRDGFGGPDAWECAAALDRWARCAIVHAAGGEVAHYQEAIRGVEYHGRCALIETTTMYAPAWAARMSCAPKLCIVPRNGGLHPLCDRAVH